MSSVIRCVCPFCENTIYLDIEDYIAAHPDSFHTEREDAKLRHPAAAIPQQPRLFAVE